MNDLTFGATLLSSFVTLAAAVIFEVSSDSTHASVAVSETQAARAAAHAAAKAAKGVTAATIAGDAACVTVALASSPSR